MKHATNSFSNCIICRGKLKVLFNLYNPQYKKEFRYLKCIKCEHIFLTPRLSDTVLFDKYIYAENDKSRSLMIEMLVDSIFTSRLYENLFTCKRFIRYAISLYSKINLKKPASYLDYGTGNSKALQFFHEMQPFAKTEGFEKSVFASKKNDFHIFHEERLLIETKSRYEIVSLFHVLEHIQNLPSFFKLLNKITSKQSIIVFQIPQATSVDIKLIPYLNNYFILRNPYHLNLFTVKSLALLLNKYGFKILESHFEIYQTHSLIENKNFFIKILFTPFLVLLSMVVRQMKMSNVITIYAQKK